MRFFNSLKMAKRIYRFCLRMVEISSNLNKISMFKELCKRWHNWNGF